MSILADLPSTWRTRAAHGTAVALAVILAITAALRLVAAGEPLWLDETFTGVMALQRTPGDLLHNIRVDVNAPLYYVVASAWGAVAGVSNAALRAPALAFGLVAPLLALLAGPILSRPVRLTWCALLACWIPGLWFSQEARCYTLALLLAVAVTAAYVAMLRRPSVRSAMAWTILGSLLVLTHYHAGLLIACQGIVYLAARRMQAVRTWPALVGFLPAAAWIAYHAPTIVAFAQPEVAWYVRLEPAAAVQALTYLVGSPLIVLVLAVGAAGLLASGLRDGRGLPKAEVDPAAMLAVWVAVAGAVVVIGIGMARPSFVPRYLTPFVPGVLLGLAIAAAAAVSRWRWAPAAMVGGFVAVALLAAWDYPRLQAKAYNFQHASDDLMAAGVQRIVFLWDHPGGAVADPGQLAAVGGFFFRRADHPVVVTPLVLAAGQDPNRAMVAAAGDDPDVGLLWISDVRVRQTAARRSPPAIERLDPLWRCGRTGARGIAIVACARRREDRP